jgi:DNA-binding transcriptional ArsR family regulator
MREPAYARGLRDHRLNGEADIARIAAAIGDEARATMLLALLGNEVLSASVLAAQARIGLPAASRHLARLVGAGLLRSERRGRQHVYQLAGPDVAQVLETLAAIAPVRPTQTLGESTRLAALRTARTCYDHLAGRLGVQLFNALVANRALVALEGWPRPAHRVRSGLGVVVLGSEAEPIFARLGVDVQTNRGAAMACLDWTEDRPHLSGRLGAQVCSAIFQRGWVIRRPDSRAVRLTPDGALALQQTVGLNLA